ncbi:MAG: PEP-CTERM sorting domain-containing protein [Rhodanobacteraceae bacterium]
MKRFSLSRFFPAIAMLGTIALVPQVSQATTTGFINGGFEDGNANGWTLGGGYRGGLYNPLNPADFLPGGSRYDSTIANSHSSIIDKSYTDPDVGSKLGTTVYSGNYSWRVEDTITGGYASVISQEVKGYTDPNIFFAWKSVLEGAHGPTDAATMIITLTDLTTGTVLISREYNAASGGGGIDPRFDFDGTYYYTPKWQIEQLAIDAALYGDDFLLSVLAADCEPTGHAGYVYLDGFGAVLPPPTTGVPEPSNLLLFGAGLGLLGVLAVSARRRRTGPASE